MSDSPAGDLERSLYYGLLVSCLLYGFDLYMYSHSLLLWLETKGKARTKRRIYIIIGALAALFTGIGILVNVVFMQHMWIERRNAPGRGPLAYLDDNSEIWYQVMGTAANVVTNCMGDALLIYRCYLIWQTNLYIVLFPMLAYLASTTVAIVFVYKSAQPGEDFFNSRDTIDLGVAWASLSVSVNIIVTALVVYQLTRIRKQLGSVLPPDALRTYTGLTAIIVESAMPFSIIGIVFAVTYGKQMDVGPAFLLVWTVFSALAPQFIIFRVTIGKSWTEDLIGRTMKESTQLSSVGFDIPDNSSQTDAVSAGSRTEAKRNFESD